MSIIESIREYFMHCPLFEGDRINVNYLSQKGGYYSIDTVPCEPVIKRYTDGGSMRQYMFTFSSREFFDEAILENMEIGRFYEELGAWCEQMSECGRLPVLGEGEGPVRLEVKTCGYLMDADIKRARWQIQLRLVYIRK